MGKAIITKIDREGTNRLTARVKRKGATKFSNTMLLKGEKKENENIEDKRIIKGGKNERFKSTNS